MVLRRENTGTNSLNDLSFSLSSIIIILTPESYFTTAPNGISASFANLKNCFPNGIPIIVIQRTQPHTAFATAIGIHVRISQKIFAIRLTAPPPYSISFPNGKNASPANLKHCLPIGIPTIVMHHKHPASSHESPDAKPPNMNHNTFPRQLIFIPLHTASIACSTATNKLFESFTFKLYPPSQLCEHHTPN